MGAFGKDLLNGLLDKYEHSVLSKGKSSNRKIKFTTSDKLFDSYVGPDSYKYADEYNDIVLELKNLKFIDVEYEFETIKAVYLKIDNVDAIYDYLGRDNPKNELGRVKKVLSKYKFNNFVDDFINYVVDYINLKQEYPKHYFQDAKQLDLLLKTFTKLFMIDEDIKKRDFSARYLGDSKVFETIEHRIVRIIRDFDSNEYLTDEDVLAAYNIVRNTSYAIIKNKLVFKLNGYVIDLNKLGYEYLLSDNMIKKLEIVKSNITKVITVENLTSFYSLDDKDALIIYLAGFHNHTKQELLKKIYSIYPEAKYYHFGDIDAGGFWIFQTLREKTNINFTPYRMCKDELISHKDNLKPLTKNDKMRLSKMKDDNRFNFFTDTINYMLENNIKLEQEVLD